MLFNSFEFFLFFPIVTILYFVLPHRFRWFLLLAASCFFYMFFKPIYVLILGFTIVIDYYAGLLIEAAPNQRKRHFYLILSLVANIGVLAIFKYYNFLNDNITGLFGLVGVEVDIPILKILLPIGLSFHTFQAMSYTIEVYRGNQKAEKHFGIYALYVMFYPQLVAGPIERPQNMLHQFHEKKTFNREMAVSGFKLILLGMFKKIVIADRLALIVDPVFNNPHAHTPLNITIASVFYAFQIYCDFSAYSEIAIGSARVMGFDLMRNFNFPYSANNLTDFWRRWHISLQTWFNDYLFKPFVTEKRDWGKWAVVIGLLLTFSISGLWHGAAWTFVMWGFMHSVVMAYEFVTKKQRSKLAKRTSPKLFNFVGHVFLAIFLVLAYVFFRANSIADAFFICGQLFHVFDGLSLSLIKNTLRPYGVLEYEYMLSFVLLFGLIMMHGTKLYYYIEGNFNRQHVLTRWTVYVGAVMIIAILGIFGRNNFIYFQF